MAGDVVGNAEVVIVSASRGMRTPFDVKSTSNPAEELGNAPDIFIPTFCENDETENETRKTE